MTPPYHLRLLSVLWVKAYRFEWLTTKVTYQTDPLSNKYSRGNKHAILLHVMQGKQKIGHWVCLLQKTPTRKIAFFDSLGMGLYKLYSFTHEEPKLLHALKGRKWENSTVQLQRFGSHFRECGAFVSIRAKFWKLTNKAFVRLIRSYNKTKPDETAVLLVLLHYLEDEEIDISSKNFKRIK